MRIAVLTSSRADYGIYLPLLKELRESSQLELKLIVFGTHVSSFHGLTKKQILEDGFEIYKEVESLVLGDAPEAISSAMGLSLIKFSSLWAQEKDQVDLILCLGDRYEMFAAVMAAVPFNIPIAHIHGGETTTGAIDNVFRHALTLASTYHFASNKLHAERISLLLGENHHIYNVGSLSLDNLRDLEFFTTSEFLNKFGVDLSVPTVLVTYHPETVALEKNEQNIKELLAALDCLDEQILITMPNADTQGNMVREHLLDFAGKNEKVFTVESLGTKGYFSAMHYCDFLIGNSSSGIIEAASFKKYVINIGDRQKGRKAGNNVFHCPADENSILSAIEQIKTLPKYDGLNIYGLGNASREIVSVLEKISKTNK